MILRLFLSYFGIQTNVRVLGISPSFFWMKPSFEAALGTGQHMPVHSMEATRFQPGALLHMPLSGSPHHGGMILCGFQREAEMEWKCLAIHFCAL